MGHHPGTARAQPCPVACCCILLGVVAQSFKPVKPLSQQRPTFSFVPWSPKHSTVFLHHTWLPWRLSAKQWLCMMDHTWWANIARSCCIHLHITANMAQQCWEVLCLFARGLRFTAFSFKRDQRIYLICLYHTKQNTILLHFARLNIMTY